MNTSAFLETSNATRGALTEATEKGHWERAVTSSSRGSGGKLKRKMRRSYIFGCDIY